MYVPGLVVVISWEISQTHQCPACVKPAVTGAEAGPLVFMWLPTSWMHLSRMWPADTDLVSPPQGGPTRFEVTLSEAFAPKPESTGLLWCFVADSISRQFQYLTRCCIPHQLQCFSS